jgi:hypothetical protein
MSGPIRRRIGSVMKRRNLLLASATLVLVVGAILWGRLGLSPPVVVDLNAMLPRAEKRTTAAAGDQPFTIEDVTIAGARRLGILAKSSSRISWAVTVPEAAILETAFGMREDSWDRPGSDGAQFRIGVSIGNAYEELMRQYVNPSADKYDRKWQTVSLDLSRYAGLPVQIVFSTDPGLPSGTNSAYDLCVWGEPRIVRGR